MSQEFKDRQSFSTRTCSTVQEPTFFAISPGDIDGVVDLCGRTPFDDLLEKSERESISSHLTAEEQAIKVEAISALLSFLFQPTKNLIPLPDEIATRCYVLAYSLAPNLVNGLSLEDIGKLFKEDPKSRQMLSKRVIKNDAALNLHARNRKSESARALYSATTKEWHRERKDEERRVARLAYSRRYKEENRVAISIMNREYYAQNKKRILEQQRRRRNAISTPATRRRRSSS